MDEPVSCVTVVDDVIWTASSSSNLIKLWSANNFLVIEDFISMHEKSIHKLLLVDHPKSKECFIWSASSDGSVVIFNFPRQAHRQLETTFRRKTLATDEEKTVSLKPISNSKEKEEILPEKEKSERVEEFVVEIAKPQKQEKKENRRSMEMLEEYSSEEQAKKQDVQFYYSFSNLGQLKQNNNTFSMRNWPKLQVKIKSEPTTQRFSLGSKNKKKNFEEHVSTNK